MMMTPKSACVQARNWGLGRNGEKNNDPFGRSRPYSLSVVMEQKVGLMILSMPSPRGPASDPAIISTDPHHGAQNT